MVKTRKSSIGLKAEVGGTTTTEESFSHTFNLQSFTKRVNNLSKKQKKAIEETGFGHLLMIPGHRLSKNLLAELMERWCPDSRAFLIVPIGMRIGSNDSTIHLKITLTDVALVLGLRAAGDPVILREDEPFSDLEEKYGAARGSRKITVVSIEKKLDSLGDAVNDDFVRLFLLFTFAKLLFPGADSKIDSRYVSLLQDLDKVPTFAWGEAVLKNIMYWLCKRKEKREQSIGGCLIFLQIWSYEHIDLARPKLINDDTLFPRACRWENTKPQSRQWFRTKFAGLDKDQVVTKLQLSPHESKIDIFNGVYTDMVDENRARLNIMDQWNADEAQEPDLIVVREVQRTKGECSDKLSDQTEPQSAPKDGFLSVVIDDEQEESIANRDLLIADKAQEPDLIVVREVRRTKGECSDKLSDQTEPQSTLKDGSLSVVIDDEQEESIANREQALLEENTELKKEISSLREENKTIKDQLKEENAETKNLREEIKVLKDQLQKQNAKLDALRRETQLTSSSSEGFTELEIIREYEQQYGVILDCNLLHLN